MFFLGKLPMQKSTEEKNFSVKLSMQKNFSWVVGTTRALVYPDKKREKNFSFVNYREKVFSL